MDGGCTFIPEVITVKEDVIDGVCITAVRTCGVVASSSTEVVEVCCVEGMSCDKLEGSRLVWAGFGSEDSMDEVGDG